MSQELSQSRDDLKIAAAEAKEAHEMSTRSSQLVSKADYLELEEQLAERDAAIMESNVATFALKQDLATAQHAAELAKKDTESAHLKLISVQENFDKLEDSTSILQPKVTELERASEVKNEAISSLEGELRATLQNLTNVQNKLLESEKLKNSGNHELDELNTVVKGMEEETNRLKKELETANNKETQLTSRANDALARYHSGIAGFELLQEELERAQGKLNDMESKTKSTDNELQKKAAESKYLTSECDKLRSELSKMQKSHAEKDSKLDSIVNDFKEKDKELEQLRDLIKQIQSDLILEESKRKDTSDSLHVLQKKFTATQDALDKVNSEKSKLNTDLSSLQGKCNYQAAELGKMQSLLDTTKTALDTANGEKTKSNAEFSNLEQKFTSQTADIEKLRAAADSQNTKIYELQQDLGKALLYSSCFILSFFL